MAGLEMRFSFDDAALVAQIDALIKRGGDLKPALDDIGQDMVTISTDAISRGRSPEGVPWPPSPTAQAEGRQTLIKQGRRGGILDSFSYAVGETDVVYGTNVPYAAIHQMGGTITAKQAKGLRFKIGEHWVTKQSVTIPARPFVGASDRDIARWEATLRDHLATA